MHIWIGAETVRVAFIGWATGAGGAPGAEVPAEDGVVEKAREETAWRSCDARAGFGGAVAVADAASGVGLNMAGVGVAPATGRRNMASMVGRSAAPKGVDRKSEGKSGCRGYQV